MRLFSKLTYQRRSEIFGFLLIVLCLFGCLSLATHTAGDDRWLWADSGEVWVADYYARNMAGTVGAILSGTLYDWFGFVSWPLTILIGLIGLRRFLRAATAKPIAYTVALTFGICLFGIIIDMPAAGRGVAWAGGAGTVSGYLGRSVGIEIADLFGVVGGILVLSSILIGAIALVVPVQTLRDLFPRKKRRPARKAHAAESPGGNARTTLKEAVAWVRTGFSGIVARVRALTESSPDPMPPPEDVAPDPLESSNWMAYRTREPQPEPPTESKPAPEQLTLPTGTQEPVRASGSGPRTVVRQNQDGPYQLPSFELLNRAEAHHRRRADTRGADLLRHTLDTFDIGIDGNIEAFPGPVITRYEFRPAPGVKVNQVSGLADDLALALSASRVRIVAPVPGKAAVGIEVPNSEPELVGLERILSDSAYHQTDAILPLALGETTDGQPFVVDLAGMPHLLIAGATGSGKSVCINVIIASLLFRHHPKNLRLLFVDPKRLELSVYSGIPHMARPVVTDPRAAERLLAEAAKEMDERYKRLAAAGVRNIVDYNAKVEEDKHLPYVVIVVDELADLMMSQSASRIEVLITRIAQMARAVGIHMILATQRPSVDVITGLIKANFSCRIAFQVASKTDSRTILDANGAEKLLGKGDMLFLAPGRPQPVRVHGALISGEETTALVEYLRSQTLEAMPLSSFSRSGGEGGDDVLTGDDDDDESDPLFAQAADVVTRHKQGSVSLLQRRLGIGYQRAARLIDKLEESGIVGPYDGSKAREVLMSREEYDQRFEKSVN